MDYSSPPIKATAPNLMLMWKNVHVNHLAAPLGQTLPIIEPQCWMLKLSHTGWRWSHPMVMNRVCNGRMKQMNYGVDETRVERPQKLQLHSKWKMTETFLKLIKHKHQASIACSTFYFFSNIWGSSVAPSTTSTHHTRLFYNKITRISFTCRLNTITNICIKH